MPTITVSDDVLAQLLALRESGEDTEDDTLRRILTAAAADKENRLKAYEKAEQDVSSTN